MLRPWLIQEAMIFPPMCQVIVHTPAEAARATEDNIRGGADVIKAQGGLTLEEYKAIVEVAHRHHVKVHAHVYLEQAARDAFSAGIDVLQHVGSAGMPPYSAALVKDIGERTAGGIDRGASGVGIAGYARVSGAA
jgi:hypothetical protein